jgi:hypothetical protein
MYPLTMISDAKTQIRIHRQSEHLIVVVKNYIRKEYLNTDFVFIYPTIEIASSYRLLFYDIHLLDFVWLKPCWDFILEL